MRRIVKIQPGRFFDFFCFLSSCNLNFTPVATLTCWGVGSIFGPVLRICLPDPINDICSLPVSRFRNIILLYHPVIISEKQKNSSVEDQILKDRTAANRLSNACRFHKNGM